MIGIEQLFIVFVLVFIIAYLVGMGIDYSAKSRFPTMVVVSEVSPPPLVVAPSAAVLPLGPSPVLVAAKDLADAVDKTSDAAIHGKGEELAEDLVKMDELRAGDLIANEAAVEEFANRLREKLGGVEDLDERELLSEKIDSIEDELTTF